ncbi:NAD-dependent epimerase/dehydratase family protein [Paenibacillus albus]|uniref:NAD(P)-dependent oxidoreductase n=1 Tax=Paenibacillus albus TaxID=2495582 RepID=A0A3S9A5M4_9BACL|nr:NAD(P)-dependent oxidoreductase [Paenibacillus albus]AZN41022.1 NAD(P)-dependent oxidoreductase [Paenibacillus albus]
MKVLVTGACGNGGQAVCRELVQAGYEVRMADVNPPSAADLRELEFVRCDTRTVTDVQQAVKGVDGVIHLAAWHCAHQPPISDDSIFAVNVDGTYQVLEACRREGIQSIVYASSMAYGWGSVYSVTKVIGEDLCRSYHEMTGASIAMLRYHEFIPRPYLEFGSKLLRNGVDRRDVARATVAALAAASKREFGLFRTIVHTNHGLPEEVRANFRDLGPDWCEEQVPGAAALISKYGISLPNEVEQHDLSEAADVLGWTPQVGFVEFLRDLKQRDERGEDVASLFVPSEL